MEAIAAGIALIVLGVSGILFRRVFVSMAQSSSSPPYAARGLPFMRWRGWIIFEVMLIAAGVVVLIVGAI